MEALSLEQDAADQRRVGDWPVLYLRDAARGARPRRRQPAISHLLGGGARSRAARPAVERTGSAASSIHRVRRGGRERRLELDRAGVPAAVLIKPAKARRSGASQR